MKTTLCPGDYHGVSCTHNWHSRDQGVLHGLCVTVLTTMDLCWQVRSPTHSHSRNAEKQTQPSPTPGQFKEGQLVWAWVKGYPFCPAVVRVTFCMVSCFCAKCNTSASVMIPAATLIVQHHASSLSALNCLHRLCLVSYILLLKFDTLATGKHAVYTQLRCSLFDLTHRETVIRQRCQCLAWTVVLPGCT